MNNIKIAKQLIKLAKSILADDNNEANNEGDYKNFTGKIQYEKNDGTVKDATFTLNAGKIIWKDGTWEDGTWDDGIWQNGVWMKGTWNNGLWYNGVWKTGTWNGNEKDNIWYEGTWEDGTWNGGTWKGGDWKGGKDADGNTHGKGDSPDKW